MQHEKDMAQLTIRLHEVSDASRKRTMSDATSKKKPKTDSYTPPLNESLENDNESSAND